MTRENLKRGYVNKILILILVAIVFAVYGQVVTHDFIFYDDQVYVKDNPRVLTGFTLDNIIWAFSSIHDHNWFPLTWISYMLHIQFFGSAPGAILLENVALHAISTILLFMFLERNTGSAWRSVTVAALFALHPLHVESVAWVSERKDVLSTFFWMLTLNLHARYAEQRSRRYYLLSLGAFFLGLMAKPMLVTLPLVMLLMDYWPLHRLPMPDDDAAGRPQLRDRVSPLRLLAEKLPFIILAAASCMITIFVQSGAINPLASSPLSGRIANALNSYVLYLKNMFIPFKLAPFYPFPDTIATWPPIGSALLLTATTLLAFRLRKRFPYLITGWLWYTITLLPVIGIVKVGSHAMADRYTYIPLVGIFIMLAWGAADAWKSRFANHTPLAVSTALILMACSVLTWRQVSFWKNTETLFTHAEAVTSNNYVASNSLGLYQKSKGNNEEALRLFDLSISRAPRSVDPHVNKANLLRTMGRNREAIEVFKQATELAPNDPVILVDLGGLLVAQGMPEDAIKYLVQGLVLAPDSGAAHYNLALALHHLGRVEEALVHYRSSLNLNPGQPITHNNMGVTLAELGRVNEAILHFREALRLKPDYDEARDNLRQALGTD